MLIIWIQKVVRFILNNKETIDDLPVHEQPDMLTKAAMDFCLADAFHPGCEMTWPMRSSGMYMSAFRVKHAKATPPVNNIYYGPTMNSDTLTLAKGPILGGQVAGGITRWMAIPWQTDTASCRDGYTTTYDPYLPTFWPARVPNNILNEKRYDQTLDSNLAEETRMEAFADRADWLSDLPLDGASPNYTNQINSMVKYFDKLAVVQKRPGVLNDPNFPKEMQVGITPTPAQEAALLKATLEDLAGILDVGTLNDETKEILTTAVDKLSDKNLLNEELLLESAQNELLTLVEDEITKDFAPTANVINTVSLIASKLHNISKTKSHQSTPEKKIEVGIPEKMTRFSRFIPK